MCIFVGISIDGISTSGSFIISFGSLLLQS